MHGMSLASLIRLLALAALWGGSFLFMRVAVPHLGAVPTAVGRGLFSMLGLGVTLAIMGDRLRLGRYLCLCWHWASSIPAFPFSCTRWRPRC